MTTTEIEQGAELGPTEHRGQFPTRSVEAVVTGLVVASCVVFTFLQLQPGLILADTTPAGGDMGAHVWAPAYLRDHLLPHWRLTGWTPDWYAGFPALHFYMVPPMLAIVLLDVVLPYGVAFKLVTVSGVLTLPVAAWAFGRLADLRYPMPALLAVATVPFLFDRTFTIYGGNIASTLAGEFSFSISLSLAVLYLGLVINGLRTGRHRGWAALVVALCALCHVIPLIFAIVGTFLLFLFYPSRAGLRWLLTSAPVGALLAAWWLLPFWGQRAFMNDMGWTKLVPPTTAGFAEQVGFWLTELFPGDTRWAAWFALAGLLIAVVRRSGPGLFLAAMALVAATGFVILPQSRLWNARLLPFVHLCVYLLGAYGIGALIRSVTARDAEVEAASWRAVGAGLTLAATLVLLGLPLRALPFGSETADGYGWLTLRTTDKSYVPDWARWNYRGYERKDGWPEYSTLMADMGELGETNGCGRAMWEYDREGLEPYGTPMAPMLLPFWTDGCIASMEGLYFESATMTPFHFLNQSALSQEPSRAQRDMPYGPFDIDLGVHQLQLMGVRYYMAYNDESKEAADDHPDLEEVARSGPWKIYEVSDSALVEGLEYEPLVVTDVHDASHEWTPFVANWFQDPARYRYLLASSGPPEWQRSDAAGVATAEHTELEPVEVTNISTTDDSISFEVSEVGRPVLVKVSYFPNWTADGARGPWRVSPSFMVVIPTETSVSLQYGRSPVELAGIGLSLAGLVGLVLLFRARPLPVPSRMAVVESDVLGGARRRGRVRKYPTRREPCGGELRLSVVIPAYNEAGVIAGTVAQVLGSLGDVQGGMELIVVDDGSTDTTAEEARAAGATRVIEQGANRGKGAAVRAGALAARGRTVAFTDADLAYSPAQVLDLMHEVEAGWDVVAGSRQVPGSTAEVPASLLRRVGGRVVNLLVRGVLAGDHADTQCGLKAFRGDVAGVIFGQSRVDGFAFDVEVFALAELYGMSLLELPVRVVNSQTSSVRLTRDTLRLVADLRRIARRLRSGAYSADAALALPPPGGAGAASPATGDTLDGQ